MAGFYNSKQSVISLSLLCGFIFIACIYCQAQIPTNEWTDEMKEKYVLLKDNMKEENFQDAKMHFNWFLQNTPNIATWLYTRGVDIYKGLAEKTQEKSQKHIYQDSALVIYDLQIEQFGDKPMTLNLKGYDADDFWLAREKYEDLYLLFKEIVELSDTLTLNQNVAGYMLMVTTLKGKKEELSIENIIDIHDHLSRIIDYNIIKYKKLDAATYGIYVDAWIKTKEYVDDLFANALGNDIDCDLIKRIFLPKLEESPDDTVLIQKITNLSFIAKCYKEPFLIELLEKQLGENAGYKEYKNLAVLYKAQGNWSKYVEYMNKAFIYGGEAKEKFDFYMELANKAARNGQLNQARNYALQAKDADPSRANVAYNFIANLYFNSGSVCKGGDPSAIYNAVAYLAAYEMFEKAGNTQMMAKCKQYFPTAGTIHTHTMTDKIGSQIPVGCWIGGTTTLRKR